MIPTAQMLEPIRQTLIGLRLSQKLKLDSLAYARGVSRSELVRKIVDDYLEEEGRRENERT